MSQASLPNPSGDEDVTGHHVGPCSGSTGLAAHDGGEPVQDAIGVGGVFGKVDHALRIGKGNQPPYDERPEEKPRPFEHFFGHFVFGEHQHSKPERSHPHGGKEERIIVQVHERS